MVMVAAHLETGEGLTPADFFPHSSFPLYTACLEASSRD